MSWTVDVYSTMVSEIGYDDTAGEMIVTWKNGKRSAYAGVDEGTALRISKAPSVEASSRQIISSWPSSVRTPSTARSTVASSL